MTCSFGGLGKQLVLDINIESLVILVGNNVIKGCSPGFAILSLSIDVCGVFDSLGVGI